MTSLTPGYAAGISSQMASMNINALNGARQPPQMSGTGFSTGDNAGSRMASRETGWPAGDAKAAIFLGYELKRLEPPNPGQEPTWKYVSRHRLPWSSDQLSAPVKKYQNNTQRGYSKLKPNIKSQVDRLVSEQERCDPNADFEWTLAALNTKHMRDGSIDVILRKQRRRVSRTVDASYSSVATSHNNPNIDFSGQQGGSRNGYPLSNVPPGQKPMNSDNFAAKAPGNNSLCTNMGPSQAPIPVNPQQGQQQPSQQFRPNMPPQQRPGVQPLDQVIDVTPGPMFNPSNPPRPPPSAIPQQSQGSPLPPPPPPPPPPQQQQRPSHNFQSPLLVNSRDEPIEIVSPTGPTNKSNHFGSPKSLPSHLASPPKQHHQQQPRPQLFNAEGPRLGQQQQQQTPPMFAQQQRQSSKDSPLAKHPQGYAAQPLPRPREFGFGKSDGLEGWQYEKSKQREHQFDVSDDESHSIYIESSDDEDSTFTTSTQTSDNPSIGGFSGSKPSDKLFDGCTDESPRNSIRREHRRQTVGVDDESRRQVPDSDLHTRRNSLLDSDSDPHTRRDSFLDLARGGHSRSHRDRVAHPDRDGNWQSHRKSFAKEDHHGRHCCHRKSQPEDGSDATRHRRRSSFVGGDHDIRDHTLYDYDEDCERPRDVVSYSSGPYLGGDKHRRGSYAKEGIPRDSYSGEGIVVRRRGLYLDEGIPEANLREPRSQQASYFYVGGGSHGQSSLNGRRQRFDDIPLSQAYRDIGRGPPRLSYDQPHRSAEPQRMEKRMSGDAGREYPGDGADTNHFPDLYNARRSSRHRYG